MKNLKKYIVKTNEKLNFVSEKILLNNSRTVFVEHNHKIIGVVTEGDILRALVRDDSLFLHAEDIMNKSFKFLQTKDEHLSKKLFKKFKITAIPILDEKMKIKDIIELWDVV